MGLTLVETKNEKLGTLREAVGEIVHKQYHRRGRSRVSRGWVYLFILAIVDGMASRFSSGELLRAPATVTGQP